MDSSPLWPRCPHLSAGTCPELWLEGPALMATGGPGAETRQDQALERLGQACRDCALAPEREGAA